MSEVQQGPRDDARTGFPATVQRSTTAKFEWVWSDAGSGAHGDVAVWRPVPEDGWYALGDYAQGDYTKPAALAVTVRQVGLSDRPLLKAPVGFTQVWNDKGSRGDHNGAIWYPEPPPGYVSVGFVASHGYRAPEVEHYACVALQWVEATGVDHKIWSDAGSGAGKDVSLYRPVDANSTFVAQGNYSPWAGVAYRLLSS
ncbi:Vps62-related protein [Actinokineospora spheciospongiae]|uniref:Vps62-related protein n=1 Tax=Actinokineospora spheciospongiae TaxID=909613 RepID=UPI000D713641|nr:Vps62-related protein [Actinokineospora spheciospongiae]PWW66741.1 uncharacterized protein DUF946 [Actinokineospora spheciospongiae]